MTAEEGCHFPAGRAGGAGGGGGGGGQGEQGWRKGLPGVEDGCVLSREGGGDGSRQAGEGLSVKRTPARGVSGTSAPRRNGCCLTHAMNASGLPRDGPDFAGILPLATPRLPRAPGSGGTSASADPRCSQHLSVWL